MCATYNYALPLNRRVGLFLVYLLLVQAGVRAADVIPASVIVDNSSHGLVTLIGFRPIDAISLSADLSDDHRYQVQCLAADFGEWSALRKEIGKRGLSGRVRVRFLTGNHLPYANNLINSLVAGQRVSGISGSEIERVLVPDGVAIVAKDVSESLGTDNLVHADLSDASWVKLKKPRSSKLDSWTHFAYDATGNMVSSDKVQDGKLYCVAGRNPFMDNGMDLHCLDPCTGRQLAVQRIYALGENNRQPPLPGVHVTGLNIDTVGPDILSSDGKHLFLRHKTLLLDKEMTMIPEPGGAPRLYASMGFLDDNFFHRTYWVYDQGNVASRYAWTFGGKGKRGGQSFGSQLAVMDAETVYHFGRKTFFMSHPKKTPAPDYHLAAVPKTPKSRTPSWSVSTDVWVRAMMVTDKRLFVGGPSGNWHTELDELEGKHAVLRSMDKASGKQLDEFRLEAPPVFNGIAATGNRAYLCLNHA